MTTVLRFLPYRPAFLWHHTLLRASTRAQSTRAVYEAPGPLVQPLHQDSVAEAIHFPRTNPARASLDKYSAGLDGRQEAAQSVVRPVNKRTNFSTEIQHTRQQQQLRVLAGTGDLKLAEFMEEVKIELWQYSALPFRRRFRIQSLLRRLQTPPFEAWIDDLVRAPDSCARCFTRTLLARQESSLSLPAIETPSFDLVLLCWNPLAASPIHDHPESSCWMKVLKGELRETRYVVAPENENETENETESEGLDSSSSGEFADTNAGGGVSSSNEEGHRRPLAETSALTYASGGVTYIEDSMGFHKMANPSVSEECVSLHLYSPGITDCNTWSDASSISDSLRATVDFDSTFAPGGMRRFGLQPRDLGINL